MGKATCPHQDLFHPVQSYNMYGCIIFVNLFVFMLYALCYNRNGEGVIGITPVTPHGKDEKSSSRLFCPVHFYSMHWWKKLSENLSQN